MAVSNTNALNLLGKYVSFIHHHKVELTDSSFVTFTQNFTGLITDIVLSLTSEPQISIGGDFYPLSELVDFKINS